MNWACPRYPAMIDRPAYVQSLGERVENCVLTFVVYHIYQAHNNVLQQAILANVGTSAIDESLT